MLIKNYRPLWNDTTVKFSFGNSGHENNNCYKYHIDEDEDTTETMIERVQNIKGVKGVERVKATRLHFLKEASRKVTGSPNQKNPVERLKVVRVEPVKVEGVHNQKRVEPVEPEECDEEYELVQQTQCLNLTTTP